MERACRTLRLWSFRLLPAAALAAAVSQATLGAQTLAVAGAKVPGTTAEPRAPQIEAMPALEVYESGPPALRRLPALAGFFAEHSDQWQVRWDLRNDLPHLIQGAGVPILPGRGNGLRRGDLGLPEAGEIGLEDVARRLRGFMARRPELFPAETQELRLNRRRSLAYGPDRYLWVVEFEQYHQGVPVIGARVFFRINHGNLVQFGSDRVAEVQVPNVPGAAKGLSAVGARQALGADAPGASKLRVLDPGGLKIYPVLPSGEEPGQPYLRRPGDGYRHRLVWEVVVGREDGAGSHRVLLDAASGQLLKSLELTRFSGATVSGEVYLETNAVPPVHRPLPYVTVENNGNHVTDAQGRYEYTGGDATVDLTSPYVSIQDACGPVHLVNSVDGNLDLGGVDDTDCETPGLGGLGNTQAARTAFYHLTQLNREAAERLPDNVWLQTPLTANVNLRAPYAGDECQAFWDEAAGTVNFHRSGPNCSSPGELPALLAHEWGHGMENNARPESPTEGASSEAAADTFALLYTRNACIGENFRPGLPCHNCRASCTGLRDLAALGLGGAATLARPDTIEDDWGLDCDRFPGPYPSSPLFQGPMGYQAHCESQIASSANWDLAQSLKAAHGAEVGWHTMKDIWYGSLATTGSAYTYTGRPRPADFDSTMVDGCGSENWYPAYLAANDDDGNLANGTPDACRIWTAFNAHGIACAQSLPCFCTQTPLADAGPDRHICAGDSITLGTTPRSDHLYVWTDTGAEPLGADPRIVVAPETTTTYTLETRTNCGTATDSVTVFVHPCGVLDESFNAGAGAWTPTGLWHLSPVSTCATSSESTGPGAMYYGLDVTCDFDTGSATRGELISPLINGITAGSYLSFDFLRQVEGSRGGRDRTEMAVRRANSSEWGTRWARDSSDASLGQWISSGAISLEPYQGESIQVRFLFDSGDEQANDYTGWFIDNVVMGTEGSWPGNTPPLVSITSPLTSGLDECLCLSCAASVNDAQDGDLSLIVDWSSSLDGPLGSGDSFQTVLSPGTHVLTASVTDSGGLSSSASVTVEVTPSGGGQPCDPGLLNWPPAEPRRYCTDKEDQ